MPETKIIERSYSCLNQGFLLILNWQELKFFSLQVSLVKINNAIAGFAKGLWI